MFGILLIDKPAGMTSHDVVARIRRKFNTKRVGHAGTLDPLATGLLVVAVGPATRFLQYHSLDPKEYESTFRFGQSTTTDDAEGEPLIEAPIPDDLDQRVLDSLPPFLGSIQQVPPLYSAIKKDGKPLYVYARKGEDVERVERRIFIYNFEPLSSPDLTPAERHFRIVCSGGTYIRSLARDLGEAVGSAAHVATLVRTKVGEFTLDQAVGLDQATQDDLIPLRESLAPLPLVSLNETQIQMVRQGRIVRPKDDPSQPIVALLDQEGEVFAIARKGENGYQPECVIPSEAVREMV